MNDRPTTLERAFELARSGKYERLTEISAALTNEGYGDARAQLYGPTLIRQLTKLCRDSRLPAG